MPDNRINTALAGPDSTPTPIVEYEYENALNAAQGQIQNIMTTEQQSAVFGFNEVRIQVTVDTYYWIGSTPAINQPSGKADILFAGIVYHEIVNPAHKITFVSANGTSEGKMFIRPVKRLP